MEMPDYIRLVKNLTERVNQQNKTIQELRESLLRFDLRCSDSSEYGACSSGIRLCRGCQGRVALSK